jgi:16S rRNA (cytidine1402-2'-O)-methyltransferase
MNIQKSFQANRSSGTLYLVATPIGNLEDMTMRAIRTLQEVALIAAEDTRNTRKLLTHFEIKTKLVSYHEHNKEASGTELIKLLLQGENIALVSDAGLPAISDPGADIARDAIGQGIAVVPIPGANAALSSLIVSGLNTDRFTFVGFLPRDKKNIVSLLQQYATYRETLIFYESPYRIEKTLSFMLECWGDREVSVARELTKRHEEVVRGLLSQCIAHFAQHEPIGEFCIVVEGMSDDELVKLEAEAQSWWQQLTIDEHVQHYEASMSHKEALKKVALDRGMSKRNIYNQIHQ